MNKKTKKQKARGAIRQLRAECAKQREKDGKMVASLSDLLGRMQSDEMFRARQMAHALRDSRCVAVFSVEEYRDDMRLQKRKRYKLDFLEWDGRYFRPSSKPSLYLDLAIDRQMTEMMKAEQVESFMRHRNRNAGAEIDRQMMKAEQVESFMRHRNRNAGAEIGIALIRSLGESV